MSNRKHEFDPVRHIRFPFTFDAARLKQELAPLYDGTWYAHYHSEDYEGDWSILALLAEKPDPSLILTRDNNQEKLVATLDPEQFPYVFELLGSFGFPITAARLMRLAPGAYIKPHTDRDLGYEDRHFRLHIPVLTNPEVYFVLDGERLLMQEGECWYINAKFEHEVRNAGHTHRIHLVIDGMRCEASDRLFFAEADPEAFRKPFTQRDLDFQEAYIAELERQPELARRFLESAYQKRDRILKDLGN